MGVNDLSIGDILKRSATYFPNRTAVVFEGRRLTYAEINDQTNRLANALTDIGVKKGDKVTVLFYNSFQFIESNFAIMKIGATAVPLNFRLAAPEFSFMIDHSDSTVVICGEEFCETIDAIRPNLPKVRTYICDSPTPPPGMLSYETLKAKSSNQEPNVAVGLEDTCQICYTSGTTGLPKGACETHHTAYWAVLTTILTFGIKDQDVGLGLLPFFHRGGWTCTVVPLFLLGGTLVTEKAFEPVSLLEAIEKEKINMAFIVPTVSARIWDLPDIGKYDLSSLRVYASIGSAMPFELKKRIIQHLPNVEFYDGFGLTEAGGGLTHTPVNDPLRQEEPGGMADFHQRLRIVDDDGKDVPLGTVGEVVVQGPAVSKGYYRNDEATKEAIKDGWFYTGELARLDEEGYYHFVDRKKDMIVTGGENVYSAEVERVIHRHPNILEAAVIGLPDEKWGERVTAVVVLKDNKEMTERELIDFCRENLAHYKCPKQVKFFNEPLPKTGNQKILKRELKARFQ